MSPVFGPAYAFASSRPGSRLLRTLAPLDRRILRATKGKYTLFGPTTRDHLLILGSNWGQQHHPGWSSNLMANPEATVAIGGSEIDVMAHALSVPDREEALKRFLTYPMYRSYRKRTARELRVFALSVRREE